jgi:hypothetical protein
MPLWPTWNRYYLVSGQEVNLDRQQEVSRNSWEGLGRVSSVGVDVECEHEDVALTVGTAILFRRIHSGDVKSSSEKCWLQITFQVCALYGTPRMSAHS